MSEIKNVALPVRADVAVLLEDYARAIEGSREADALYARDAILRCFSEASIWIPTNERLPQPEVVDGETADFVPVIFNVRGTNRSVWAGRFLVGTMRYRWRSLQGLECTDADVSHWMPLPKAPK